MPASPSSPFDMRATLQALASHLESNGYFTQTGIGEPKGVINVSGTQFYGVVIPSRIRVVKVMLDGSPMEVHTVMIRVYEDWMAEPQEEAEIMLSNMVSQIISDLMGGFKLNNTVRAVDIAGIYGESVGARWGTISISNRLWRAVDITVPCIVDDDYLDVAE